MKLKFTDHFKYRAFTRGLSIDQIKKAIREPDYQKNVFEGRILVQKKIGNNKIEVVYCKSSLSSKKEEYIVITAYYL